MILVRLRPSRVWTSKTEDWTSSSRVKFQKASALGKYGVSGKEVQEERAAMLQGLPGTVAVPGKGSVSAQQGFGALKDKNCPSDW